MKLDEYILEVLDHTYRVDKEDNRLYDKNLHVSDLLDFCPRKIALCHKYNVPIHSRKYVGKGLALTFEIGKKIQSIVINRLNKSGLLVGTWVCLSCNYKYFGIREKECPSCNKKTYLNYIDTKLTLTKYGIPVVGNVDVLLAAISKEIIVVEVKSMKVDQFTELTSPLRLHKEQLSLYLWLLSKKASIKHKGAEVNKLKGLKIRTDSGVILYVCKQQKKEPRKAFVIRPDKEFIKNIESKLTLLKTYSKDSKMIKPVCTSEANFMARSCHMRQQCFKNRKKRLT